MGIAQAQVKICVNVVNAVSIVKTHNRVSLNAAAELSVGLAKVKDILIDFSYYIFAIIYLIN